MTKDQLIEQAKSFGIDTEGLNHKALQAEVSKAKAAAKAEEDAKAAQEKVAADALAAEEAKVAGEKAIADAKAEADAKAAQEAADAETKAIEDARLAREAEETRIAEEAKAAEDARIAEEVRLQSAKDAQKAEEEKLAKEAKGKGSKQQKIDKHALNVKLVDDETAPRKEVVPFTPIAYKSKSGDFEVTVPKFRYRGNEYDTATAIEQNPDLIEDLIRLKSFIVKRK